MKFLLSFLTLILTLSSCDSSKKTIESDLQMQQDILSETYNITQVGSNDNISTEITLSFDQATNKFTGFAGCNSFFGAYSIQDNTIKFSNIAASKKFCPNEIGTLENHFLKALNTTTHYSIKDNTITLSDNENILIKGATQPAVPNKNDQVNYKTKLEVTYKTFSRTSFDFILVSESRILTSEDKGLQNTSTNQTESNDWEEIKALIEAIDLNTIPKLKPPSTKHQYDGAAHATVAIIMGDTEYMTPTFDQGNPPQTIKDLVNKVLSVKEKLAKQ